MADEQDRAYEVASADVVLPVSNEQCDLLLKALDEWEYEGLSDPKYRDSGYVHGVGSDDEENAETITKVRALVALIEKTREAS
jgi:hypothetical protein